MLREGYPDADSVEFLSPIHVFSHSSLDIEKPYVTVCQSLHLDAPDTELAGDDSLLHC